MLERQAICFPCCFARANAGKSSAASMAIIAITTSSSMSVKPLIDRHLLFDAARVRKHRCSVFIWGTSADPFSASTQNSTPFDAEAGGSRPTARVLFRAPESTNFRDMKTPFARFSSLLFALGSLGVLRAADSPLTDGKWVDLTHE